MDNESSGWRICEERERNFGIGWRVLKRDGHGVKVLIGALVFEKGKVVVVVCGFERKRERDRKKVVWKFRERRKVEDG